jgi:hypothetical protein
MARFLIWTTMLFVACDPGPPNLDTGDVGLDRGGEQPGDWNAAPGNGEPDADPVAGEAPQIRGAGLVCFEHTVGDHNYVWLLTLDATDPQGADTIAPMIEGIELYEASTGRTIRYVLACAPDGACTGSWLDTDDGVSCLAVDDYTVTVSVVDEDGHWSPARDVLPWFDPTTDTGA